MLQLSTHYLISNNNNYWNKVEPLVYKCALTALIGIGTFFLCEGIVRIPFLFNSSRYLPIHPGFIYVAGKLRNLQNRMEFVIAYVLKKSYTVTLYFCICGPLIEELAHRLIFQELCLKQGVKFCAKFLLVSFDPNNVYAKISRVALSSLVFAAQHHWAFSTTLAINPYGAATLVYLVVMGSILGATQETTGNTTYPIAIHVINNTLTHYFT